MAGGCVLTVRHGTCDILGLTRVGQPSSLLEHRPAGAGALPVPPVAPVAESWGDHSASAGERL